MRRSTVPVILLAALSFFAGLGRGAISDTDEAFYAESSREMVESGDWLTPHFNYEPRFQKPALFYWLTSVAYGPAGPNEFAARVWSALAGVGLVLIVTACGRRWFDETTGLLAGAITATNFGYFALARMSLPDLPLAFFITLAIWAAFVATLEREHSPRRWLLLAATAAALGFLMKGPLALLIPVLVVLPILLMERRSFNVELADVVLALLLFVAIASPWYLAMWAQHGTAYMREFFVGDNFERFATSRFNDPRPWWFYFPVLAGGLLPWTPLAIVWVGPFFQFLTRRRDISSVDLRLLLWAAIPLVFFTLSVGKQPRYILPVLPPLAVLLAGSIIERTREWRSLGGARVRPRPNRAVVFGCVLGGLCLVGLGALLYRAQPLFLNVDPWLTLATAIVSAVGGGAVVLVSLTSAWRGAPGILAVAAALTFCMLPFGVLSAPADSAVKQIANTVRSARVNDEAIGTYRVFVRNLVFYTGVQHTDIINDEHLAEWITRNPRALIVMSSSEADRFERERRFTLRRLAALPYFNDGGIKVRMLLWPDPSTDLESVVVVQVND
ncbi:MAG TPA: glycosyltransferase family 39 protein [Vicinamibacterales bacterium]|nr:glycosyltransferase family 39 protein [Vicinamibacterales bacterium]